MFRVQFKTMLVIMITACITILAYDSFRERVEAIDFEAAVASWKSKPPVLAPDAETNGSVTIILPVLATTSTNTVVSVPDGGLCAQERLLSGRVYGRRLDVPGNQPAVSESAQEK